MSSTDDTLTIVFQDDNYTVAKMTSYSLVRAFMSPASNFDCTVYEDDYLKFVTLRDKIAIFGRRVQILVNGVFQMSGIVEHTTIGDDGTCIKIKGRDYLADVLVGDVPQKAIISDGTPIDKAVLQIFKPFGITKVDYTGNNTTRGLLTGLGGAQFKRLNNSIKDPRKSNCTYCHSEPNAKAFEFANKLCVKEGFTIQSTTLNDTISLSCPEYDQAPSYFGLYRYFDKSNPKHNVLSGLVERDFSEVPTVVTNFCNVPSSDGFDYVQQAYSRAVFSPQIDGLESPPALFPDIQNNAEFTRIFSETTVIGNVYKDGTNADPNAIYRPAFFSDKKSTTQAQLKNVMRRQLSGRFAKTLQCTYVVPNHSQNGIIWTPDTITSVVDQVGGVEENLWIEGVTFNYSSGSGATTTLKCWRTFSYIVGE